MSEPYRCAICRRLRLEINHWWLGFSRPGGWQFSPWSDEIAEQRGVDHMCSRHCLTVWVDRKAEEETFKLQHPVVSRL